MSVQHYFTATSAVTFPPVWSSFTRGVRSTQQIRKLFWHAPAQKLVALFTTITTDPAIGNTFFGASWRFAYLWRDGTAVDLISTAVQGIEHSFLQVTHTARGDVVRANFPEGVAHTEVTSSQGTEALFPLSERWAQDILPLHAASGDIWGSARGYDASYHTVTGSAGFFVSPLLAANTFVITARPAGTVMFSATGSTWNHIRDLMYIDASRTAATFMQDSGGTVNASAPALIRLFNTTSTPWTLLWTDTLPATDSVCAYDPQYEVLYSCGKWPSNAVMHASKLKQAPASLSVLTLVSGSVLQEMRIGQISVLVTDGQGSGLSGTLVCWTLSAAVSGGTLLSAYTTTNASGIAYATYIGPKLSGTTTTDFVSAAVATIDPVGV